MGFELHDNLGEPEWKHDRDIAVGGKLVGKIAVAEVVPKHIKYHVCINLEHVDCSIKHSVPLGVHTPLVQGCADTREEALLEAFRASKRGAENYLARLESLRKEMFENDE